MGGSSNSSSTSTSKTQLQPTSTTNPYFKSSTDKNGNTVTNFQNGTAGQTAYNFVNNNISRLLDNYLHPSLDSVTNQAKLGQFNKQQQANLQNNIINPLATNNMVRSSQATNMYNNLSNQAADYTNSLLAEDQNNTWNMINNLMNLYTQGYTGSAAEENASLKASTGAGDTVTTSKTTAK